ncbi:chitin-binding lectin 1-like [Trichosurus vulpecula]|uniref:chitin-binding lectin 1-like n=1 Tax=Trichosurus vulpecula TaxID=9337 RepID=UPI00186B2E9A|nr:chitin-binding lectin 1-like [Trichosurus vulpecula]
MWREKGSPGPHAWRSCVLRFGRQPPSSREAGSPSEYTCCAHLLTCGPPLLPPLPSKYQPPRKPLGAPRPQPPQPPPPQRSHCDRPTHLKGPRLPRGAPSPLPSLPPPASAGGSIYNSGAYSEPRVHSRLLRRSNLRWDLCAPQGLGRVQDSAMGASVA